MGSGWRSGALPSDAGAATCCATACSIHLRLLRGPAGSDVEASWQQGESRADPTLDRRELAAYTAVASVILNLDETVTKE